MAKKMIIMDVMNETAEMRIETKGYVGMKCIEESAFLKEALGVEMEQELKPVAYKNEKEESVRVFKPLCG